MEASDYIAFSSAVIALSALGIAIWQAHLSRRHFILSITPHLVIQKDVASGNCEFVLENNGLGPAIIEEIYLVVKEEEILLNNGEAYDEALEKIDSPIDHVRYYPSKNDAILPSQKISLFEVEKEVGINYQDHIINIEKNLKFKITYTSMYKDKKFEYFGND